MTKGKNISKAISILGISGSLRVESFNTTLLHHAAQVAESSAHLELWPELDIIPPFNEDHECEPADAVRRMRVAITNADAVLISTPEYNTTLPGQLKTLLDWASRPTRRGVFAGKPTAVIGASLTPYGAKWAQETVRTILNACGANVIDEPLCIAHADTAFDTQGSLHEAAAQSQLAHVVNELTQAARTVHNPAVQPTP